MVPWNVFLGLDVFIKMQSTGNAVLELLQEFFQESIGLNCGLELRSPVSK